ncbi:ABC transporter substrate-binding protein [Gelria sp. Kuro-4]|uniref:ABC transporter substrate-binding protein n=1 Tax=Gelria sp. Kuro-4 TaxID=2796927 RepID=UPI001C7F14D8|nr:ABC transporter substrate-binding protein [Gelria sp. Kuro-4]
MGRKRWFGLAAAVVAAAVVLAGCSGSKPAAEKEGASGGSEAAVIKIGTVGPLSGNAATYGQSTKHGVEIAVDEVNKAGGISGTQVELVPEDSRGDQTEAANATRKLVEQDKVVAIVGAVLSSETLSGGPIANDAKVPMISSSSTAPGIPDIGPYIFRNCISDNVQAAQLAEYAVQELKVKRFAVMFTNNDYGMALRDGFTAKAKELGEVVAVEAYTDGDANFSAQLTKIKAQNPDALYIGGYYTEAAKIAQQAKEMGLKVQLLGADGFYSSKLTELGGDAVEGAVFTAGFYSGDTSPAVQNFVAAYKAKFNEEPDMFAAQAYDAAKIVLEAIKKAGSTDTTKIQAALAATRDFPGITGTTSFTANGDAEKDIVILKVEQGKFVRVR